jgi:hypothetical protein
VRPVARHFTFEYWAGRLGGPARQTLVLGRHFFQRLFQNDVFAFEEQMKEKVYLLLAMIAAAGWALTTTLFGQYMFVPDSGQSWLEKMAFLAIFMLFLGLAVVLEWDVLFPDARDHLNLTHLPVRPRTVIAAKFGAFAVFVAAYTAAASIFSVFAISFFLPRWNGDTLGSLLGYAVAHVASQAAAYTFVFLFFLLLEAVLMALLGERFFRAVSLLARFVLILGAAAVVILTLTDLGAVQSLLEKVAWMKESRPAALLWWPPVWFVSMYECLIGRASAFYQAGANIGLASLLVLALACRLAMAAALQRRYRRAGEVRAVRPGLARRLGRAWAGALDQVLFRSQPEKAVFHFMAGTIRKSAAHKVRLVGWSAVSLGAIFLIAGSRRGNWTSPAQAGFGVLEAPLALGFFLLLGLRSAFDLPYATDAGWAFRLTERANLGPYFAAVKKLIAVGMLLPLAAVTFLIHARLWGTGPAALHALYALAWLALFAEALFWKYASIPFVCKVVPGKAKLHAMWLPFAVGFIVGLALLASWEKALFRNPGLFAVSLAALAAIGLGLEFYQRRFVYPRLALVYEEEPEPVMVTL